MVSVSDKITLIVQGVVEGLYGHVETDTPYWNSLNQYCEDFLAAYSDSPHLEVLVDGVKKAILEHPLHHFPVSQTHLKNTVLWWQNCLKKQTTSFFDSPNLKNLTSPCTIVENPKFIYKSMSRNAYKSDTTVTLLEEYDIIGHGTTGLTSWQGNFSRKHILGNP